MPRGRKSHNLSQASNNDDEDMPLSQSQSQRGAVTLPQADAARLATRVVRYVLAARGRGAPLRRADVRRLVVPPQYHKSFKQIMQVATEQLERVFGLSLMELTNKRDLMLVNRLPVSSDKPHVQLREDEQQRRGLLVAVLALIFMNNESVKEDLLWTFLKRLGIEQSVPHKCFGDVKKLLTKDFVRANYLKVQEVQQGDKTTLEFKWGEAAFFMVHRMNLLTFVCEIWGENIKPENWTEQYQRLMLEEQQTQQLAQQVSQQ